MNLLRPDRLQALAREHAVGTLQGGARRRFERLLHESVAARQALAHWQEQFAVLAAATPPAPPSPRVWAALEQRLGLKPVPKAWHRWLDGRIWGGAVAGALCVLIVTTATLQSHPGRLGFEPLSEGLPPSYVGLLSAPAGQPGLLLSSRRHGKVLTAKLLQPLPAPQGQVATLWAYPKDATAPFRVGTLPASGGASILLPEPAEKLFFTVDRLGVSFEPTGSASPSPIAPSSALVLAGPCVKLW